MKIIISDRADKELKSTVLYLQAEFGSRIRRRFMQDYRHILSLLRKHPHLGPVEPLLEGLPLVYRSIVLGSLNKLIYTVQKDAMKRIRF